MRCRTIETAALLLAAARAEAAPATNLKLGYKTLRRLVQDLRPATQLVARMDAGGSDSVLTRAAGIPAYGAASIFCGVGDSRHHAPDARISKAAFEDGLQFTYRLMNGLSGHGRGRKAGADR